MLALRDGLTRPQSCAVGAESVKDGTGVGSATSRTSASSGEGAGRHGRARSAAASLEIERPRETMGRQDVMADTPGGGPGPSWRIKYMDRFDHLGLGTLG